MQPASATGKEFWRASKKTTKHVLKMYQRRHLLWLLLALQVNVSCSSDQHRNHSCNGKPALKCSPKPIAMTASGIEITGESMREVLLGGEATMVLNASPALPHETTVYRVSSDEHVPWQQVSHTVQIKDDVRQ